MKKFWEIIMVVVRIAAVCIAIFLCIREHNSSDPYGVMKVWWWAGLVYAFCFVIVGVPCFVIVKILKAIYTHLYGAPVGVFDSGSSEIMYDSTDASKKWEPLDDYETELANERWRNQYNDWHEESLAKEEAAYEEEQQYYRDVEAYDDWYNN